MPIVLALLAFIMGTSVPAIAQTTTPTGPGAAGQARPTRGPEQSSVPNKAPAATTGQTTAERNPNPTVQQMNQSEKSKVETHGK